MYNAEQGLERKGGRGKDDMHKKKIQRQQEPTTPTGERNTSTIYRHEKTEKEKMYKKGMYKYKKVGKNEIFVAFVVLGFERRR